MDWTVKESGFDHRHRQDIFIFDMATNSALVRTQFHIQWVPGQLVPGMKR